MIIDLQPAYLQTLSVGQHELTVLFNDGAPITTSFTIEAASDVGPNTGDHNPIAFWVILMAAALVSCVGILAVLHKKREQ